MTILRCGLSPNYFRHLFLIFVNILKFVEAFVNSYSSIIFVLRHFSNRHDVQYPGHSHCHVISAPAERDVTDVIYLAYHQLCTVLRLIWPATQALHIDLYACVYPCLYCYSHEISVHATCGRGSMVVPYVMYFRFCG